jgi:hypothetical protein
MADANCTPDDMPPPEKPIAQMTIAELTQFVARLEQKYGQVAQDPMADGAEEGPIT